MAEVNDMGVEERIATGCGFSVGDYHLGRVDRWCDDDLDTLERYLSDIIEEAGLAMDAVRSVRAARYDADTISRQGRFAIE